MKEPRKPKGGRPRDGRVWTAADDALVRDLTERGKPVSAAVRLKCTYAEVVQRYCELTEGRKVRKPKAGDGAEGPISESRMEAVRNASRNRGANAASLAILHALPPVAFALLPKLWGPGKAGYRRLHKHPALRAIAALRCARRRRACRT